MISIGVAGGRFLLTFRDLTEALAGIARFTPVRSEDIAILTCFRDYEPEGVIIHDLVYRRQDGVWHFSGSCYRKLRLSADVMSRRFSDPTEGVKQMARQADWYFDYISPYPYLQMSRFRELPEDLVVRPRPVLFAALLNHWGHKGPAEIPAKRRQTYFYTRWLADQRGLPFKGPPRHPFNPLALLRLTIAAGSTLEAVRIVYEHVFGEGNDGQEESSVAALGKKLGILDVAEVLTRQSIKEELRANTTEAIERGVFGVPTFSYAGEIFWGDDATPLFVDFLADPKMFEREPYAGIDEVVPAAQRNPNVRK